MKKVIEGNERFYVEKDVKINLPETLPDHLRKQFEDYTVTATQFNCYDEPHEFETHLLWDDLCVIYETLRELILDGKLKDK